MNEVLFEGFEPANTTPVPDILFDQLLTELSGAELKVMLYIIRRTWGFKKDTDAISYNQFTEGITTKEGKVLDRGCGIKNRTVLSKALAEMECRGYITSTKGNDSCGDKATTLYSIKFKTQGVVTKPYHPVQMGSNQTVPPVVSKPYYGSNQTVPGVVTKPYLQETVLQETVLQDTSVSADAERIRDSFFQFVDELERGKYTSSEDYPIATPAHDTTNDKAEQGDAHGNDHRTVGNIGRNSNGILGSDTHETSGNQNRIESTQQQEIDDDFFAPFPPEILAHPGKQAELSPSNVDKQANGVEKSVQDTEKTGKPREKPAPKAQGNDLPPDVQEVIDNYQQLFKEPIPITDGIKKAARELAPCHPTVEDLKAVRIFCWNNNPEWYGKNGKTHGRVTLKDIASNWEGWKASQQAQQQSQRQRQTDTTSDALMKAPTVNGVRNLAVEMDAMEAKYMKNRKKA